MILYYGNKPSRGAIRGALELYKPEEEKEMIEITKTDELWTRLTGKLVDIERRPTQWGDKDVLVIELKDGTRRNVYKTASMAGLHSGYIGQVVSLVREIRPNGKSHIRVFVKDIVSAPADDAEDYDPFMDE